MRALILVAGAALALSGCAMTPAQKVDLGCELAVLGAQTTGDIAAIAEQHGMSHDRAVKLQQRAATGENVVTDICTVATSVLGL